MSLSSLIRGKREPARFATATPATFATHGEEMGRTVASVATVNVAKSPAETDPLGLNDLPAALIEAASRVCREIHGDPPEAVAAMLDDLRYYPSASWPWLIEHFRQQLPPTAQKSQPAKAARVTCDTCRHAIAIEAHSMLADCAAGVNPGCPTGRHWKSDPHHCEHWERGMNTTDLNRFIEGANDGKA